MTIKFIIEEFNSELVNVNEFSESLQKAKALVDNLSVIENITGTKYAKYIDYDIVLQGTNYADEFIIVKHGKIVEEFPIEILTSEQAERNEKEEITGGCVVGVASTVGYKLGETVQTYIQIGNTNYWYREL